uniref:GRIP domain-containing protein n=1 Tax=Panagrellus redivivus TaxID=6233 RepID=A0A7E4VQZ4_PANRE
MTSNKSLDISADGGRMTLNGTYTVEGMGDFDVEKDCAITDEPSMQRDTETRPISGLSINTSSSDSLPMDVHDDCSIDLGNMDASFHRSSTHTSIQGSDAAGVRYMKDGYDSLKRASQEMFTRLQCTAAFLDTLNTALRGQMDPVSQELVNQISNLKLNAVISEVDEAFAVADEAEKSMGFATFDKSMPSLTSSSRNQSIGSIVTAEAAVIKSQVIELKEKLADLEAQLAEATSQLAIKDEIIEEVTQERDTIRLRLHELTKGIENGANGESEADTAFAEEDQDHGRKFETAISATVKLVQEIEEYQDAQEVEIGKLRADLKEAKDESVALLKELQQTQASINKQTRITMKLNKKCANGSAGGDDGPKKAETVDMEVQFGADFRTSASEEANLELLTEKCSEYEAYLKAMAQMAVSEDGDGTLVEPPKVIDPSIHESIMSAITAAKKMDSEGFQRVMDELAHASDMTLVENNPDATLEVAKILDRVSKSKELSNLLVQTLKKLSTEPEKVVSAVPRLLQWSRDSRETHIFVEAHLNAFKKATTPVNEHIPEILSEVEGIYKVLRDVQNDRIAAKRNRMATKPGKK